ncbi:hypothetical protein B7486_13340 [cyanobacterium TDX16]|nr:hypothetical protein B7486_13340 [cyanobacterium TDX16]
MPTDWDPWAWGAAWNGEFPWKPTVSDGRYGDCERYNPVGGVLPAGPSREAMWECGERIGEDIRMLKQAGLVSSVVLIVFAGQTALAGPVLDIDPGLMGIPRGGVIFEQLPNRSGGPAADTDYISGNGLPYWQLEADNILLSESALIRHITWWGFYGGDSDPSPGADDPPTGPETMRIRLYSARAGDGLPDSSDILFEESFHNPSRTATGRRILTPTAPDEYRFEADLAVPFTLISGLPYWLEVVQFGDQASLFRWEHGTGLINGRAFNNPIVPNWYGTEGSFAFQLSTIPEPSSFGLLLACVVLSTLLGPGGRRATSR